jgi:predicted RNase H-like HicB family nuclease
MIYYALIEKPTNDSQAFGVVVPDIPGCFSGGDTLDEAISNGREAIIMQLEDITARGESVPESHVDDILAAKKKRGWLYFGIEVNLDHVSTKVERINLTVPNGALNAIDEAAKKRHMNRSVFMTEAALEKIRNLS